MQYSREEVEAHHYEDDCWVIIDDNVYDVSTFVKDHPGGDILYLCGGGRDVTGLFETIHHGDMSWILEPYRIGSLQASETSVARFVYDSPLRTELNRRVYQHLKAEGIAHRQSGFTLWKAGFWVLGSVIFYALTYFVLADRWVPMLASAAITGLFLACAMMNIMHDSCHGTFSGHRRLNRAARYIFDLYGASSYMWIMTHNHDHHVYANVLGRDPDGDAAKHVLRTKPNHPYRAHHRFQHIYCFVLYALHSLSWPIDDVNRIITGKAASIRLHKFRYLHLPPKELALFVLTRIIFLAYSFALPISLVGLAKTLVCFLVMHMVEGLVLAVVIGSEHINSEAEIRDREDRVCWAEHIVRATSNVHATSPFWGRVASFFTGGLNYHVEHHLFPNFNHGHLHRVAPIVQDVCDEFDLPYTNQRSYLSLFASHWRYVRSLSRKADVNHRSPWSKEAAQRS